MEFHPIPVVVPTAAERNGGLLGYGHSIPTATIQDKLVADVFNMPRCNLGASVGSALRYAFFSRQHCSVELPGPGRSRPHENATVPCPNMPTPKCSNLTPRWRQTLFRSIPNGRFPCQPVSR